MKFYFSASDSPRVQKILRKFVKRYGQTKSPADADVIVALGGDGQALVALKDGIRFKKPVFGLNFGVTGFLLNPFKKKKDLKNLPKRIKASEAAKLKPLRIKAEFHNGDIKKDFAINEVHVCNHDRSKCVYLRVSINKKERVPRLGGDGLIVSTPVGSTGYNKAAGGQVLPLDVNGIALTPNNATGMLAGTIKPKPIVVEVLRNPYHTGDVYVDDHCVGIDCLRVKIREDDKNTVKLLFDRGSFREKMARVQFSTPAGP